MAVITATSDFGTSDITLSRAKVQFIRRVKDLHWVDVSHGVEPHNLSQAAFILRRAYVAFPPGTIHLMFVGGAPFEGIEYICIKADGQFFIAPNNGVLASVLENAKIVAARVLDIRGVEALDWFGLFAAAASHLSEGGKVDLLGPSLKSIKRIKEQVPVTSEQAIRGNVVYIDHYGTCVTNISKAMFDAVQQGRRASVETSRNRSISKIYTHIGAVPQGKIAGIWDEFGMLCVAVGKSGGEHIKGSNELLGLNVHDWVRIDFV
jgi:S-adenosylmethionine hydrolase